MMKQLDNFIIGYRTRFRKNKNGNDIIIQPVFLLWLMNTWKYKSDFKSDKWRWSFKIVMSIFRITQAQQDLLNHVGQGP